MFTTGLARLLATLPLQQVHWAPRAETAVGPVDTNPGVPRPPSPSHSCSVSAREGTLRTSVFPEAASGCHQYIYSKRGRIFSEQGGKQRLQLKLITEQQSFRLPSLQLRNLGQHSNVTEIRKLQELLSSVRNS